MMDCAAVPDGREVSSLWLQTLITIAAVWKSMVLGAGLILMTTVAGWGIARTPAFPPVRIVAWWVRRLVKPLLSCRSWWVRAVAIFVNNTSILVIIVALGQWRWIALAAVACLGLSLGMGLRILAEDPDTSLHVNPSADHSMAKGVWIGIVLNLLEPPAIMLAIGLSMGRHVVPLSPEDVWTTFALWVVPATLIAAGGEALWLGAYRTEEGVGERPVPDIPHKDRTP